MFPGAAASIERNEAGEPVGWDYPQYDEGPDPDDFDELEYDEDEQNDETVACDFCGREFDDIDEHNRHRDVEHIGERL